MERTETTRFLVRVHVRRRAGQPPNYLQDVRHYNCETLAQAQARVTMETKRDGNSQVEVFILIESWRPRGS